ncbi:hypothetical protein GCM10022225_73390 [Plantactinospora mayteni]|uniref:Uncharacterized protein n=1 Tax=Plantactinospora mayteni TaxID=566021 RepID=A0ABQ4F1K7_9ACTN|nr:DUF6223 family protein [Plantactinospora mayteni]GIH00794.1 hypothetical protein Pma05_73660 [Plantactinospora mayteni]
MPVRRLFTVFTALLGGFGLATPSAAHASAQSAAVDAYTMTAGRLVGSVAALVALAGVVVGGLALARSAGRIGNGTGKRGAIVALAAGLTGMVGGGLVVAAAEGGPGTGYGIVGGFVALVIGLIATVLGWLALARSRRTV